MLSLTANSAIIQNTSNDGAISLTQTYSFSAANVLQVNELVTNTSGGILTAVEFQRDVDWDVYPTEFQEITTIPGVGSDGPADLGGGIKISVGTLAARATSNFNYFYALNTIGESPTSLQTQVEGLGGAYVVLTNSSDGACPTCGTNSAAIAYQSAGQVISASFYGFELADPSVAYFDTTPSGPITFSSSSTTTSSGTTGVPVTYLVAPPRPVVYFPLGTGTETGGSPPPGSLPPPGGTGSSGGFTLGGLDDGLKLADSVTGTGSGTPVDPVFVVNSVVPATRAVALGQLSSHQISPGVWVSSPTNVQHPGANGISSGSVVFSSDGAYQSLSPGGTTIVSPGGTTVVQ